jgi:hypothetical protein
MDRTEELFKSVKFVDENYKFDDNFSLTPFVQVSIKISCSLKGNEVLVTKMEKL